MTLGGSPQAATLDAYVSYELEVNVDASLTPAIDEIDTDGPVVVIRLSARSVRAEAGRAAGPS